MSDYPSPLKFSLTAPLNKGDSKETTYGCRHSDPDICGSCYMDGICAFSSNDKICKRPSKKWLKTYYKLGGK